MIEGESIIDFCGAVRQTKAGKWLPRANPKVGRSIDVEVEQDWVDG